MAVREGPVRLGVIGSGGFGHFALQHFTQIPGIKLVGMAGTHRDASYATARRFGIPDIVDVEVLTASPEIDLVYISTPPFLHYPQAMSALRAGKHVICEKPLAMTPDQAEEMVGLARSKNLLLVANLMQRYNPLYDAVGRLIQTRALGDFLHAFFENYASDEFLLEDHWFWDREKSGGIFVEHGVHFFDLFAGWLGQGRVVAAQSSRRPGTDVEDQVQCTVRYSETVLVNFYHGFHQPRQMDRQQMRLLFEQGDVTLEEWVPTRFKLHAMVDESQTRTLTEIFPRASLDITTVYPQEERSSRGRGKFIDAYQMIEMSQGEGQKKMHLYGQLLRSMMEDQLAWLRDRSHKRKITEQNGLDSVIMAWEATQLARREER